MQKKYRKSGRGNECRVYENNRKGGGLSGCFHTQKSSRYPSREACNRFSARWSAASARAILTLVLCFA